MQIEFRLPSLGADMERATLTQWLKKPGDPVHRGEAIAVVETDKGLIDIESFDDATVTELLVPPGTRMAVGTLMARLSGEGAAVRPVLNLTLAADHRVTDGRIGSRFLKTIAELLAAPEKL